VTGPSGGSPTSTKTPVVWALLGRRTGDNLQVEALADALGWSFERKTLSYRRRYFTWTPFYGRMKPSLAPLTTASRTQLAPPWPDLVVSIGWRSPPVARWIAQQGGSRLIAIGRPRAPLDYFDLVLTTPQYRLPEADNLVQLDAPVTRLSPAALDAAAEKWRDRFAHLPRPWIAVLVGGNAVPFRLTVAAATRLGAMANEFARERRGSLLIATGPRTPPDAAQALLSRIDVASYQYLWGSGDENPYFGFLALADDLIVTSESISMVHEAALSGKPVHLFDVPMIGGWFLRGLIKLDKYLQSSAGGISERYRRLIHAGWICPPRDVEAFYSNLITSGHATRLGDPTPTAVRATQVTDRDRAVSAIRRLLAPIG